MKPPCQLSARAQEEWDKLADTVQPSDAAVLAAYCEQVAQWEDWQEAYRTGTGKDKLKASIRIRDCVIQMKSLAAEFGLTPASRKRLAEKQDEQDELDAFLAEG